MMMTSINIMIRMVIFFANAFGYSYYDQHKGRCAVDRDFVHIEEPREGPGRTRKKKHDNYDDDNDDNDDSYDNDDNDDDNNDDVNHIELHGSDRKSYENHIKPHQKVLEFLDIWIK